MHLNGTLACLIIEPEHLNWIYSIDFQFFNYDFRFVIMEIQAVTTAAFHRTGSLRWAFHKTDICNALIAKKVTQNLNEGLQFRL